MIQNKGFNPNFLQLSTSKTAKDTLFLSPKSTNLKVKSESSLDKRAEDPK